MLSVCLFSLLVYVPFVTVDAFTAHNSFDDDYCNTHGYRAPRPDLFTVTQCAAAGGTINRTQAMRACVMRMT